jgi:endonuclease YncB( thermonuclease family)
MPHDFNQFPELTTSQLDLYYFQSPHRQILEDFSAEVVKVHDGDTVTLRWNERDFDFPLRFINIAAPELSEVGGNESRDWLENMVLGTMVDIKMTRRNRVDKWGRLLGNLVHHGRDMGEESMLMGHSTSWSNRADGLIPDFQTELNKHGTI